MESRRLKNFVPTAGTEGYTRVDVCGSVEGYPARRIVEDEENQFMFWHGVLAAGVGLL